MILFKLSSNAGNFKITIRGCVIKRATTTKYLGFLIDETPSWKNCLSVIAEKLSRGLRVIRRTKILVPKKDSKNDLFFYIFSIY